MNFWKDVKRSLLTTYFLAYALFLVIEPAHVQAQTKVVGYVTNHSVVPIDYNRITHLNLAFENPDVAGNLSYSPSNDIYIQQAHAHGKKVLVSIAGGGASHNPAMQTLYFNLISDQNRTAFVQKIVAYISLHNLDGLDVDLEGPSINQDYGKFVADLSGLLQPQGKLLTTALSHMNGADNVPDGAMHLFDFVNIMAYDSTGPWRPDHPGQHSSFEFAKQSLDYWINRGLPREKAVLGVPFYGYGFGTNFNEGVSFADLIKTYPGAENRDVSGNTIYYNGIPTISEKAQYVVDGKYGGIMIWQLAQDATGPLSLLTTIDRVIKNTARTGNASEEIESYPEPVDSVIDLTIFGFQHNSLRIVDELGKEYAVNVAKAGLLDVTMLPSGLYILRLTNDEGSLTRKFLKK
jgi:hypothetical protein